MTDWVLDLDFDFCICPTPIRGRSDRRGEIQDGQLWITADELAAWLRSRDLLHPTTFAGWVHRHEQVLPIWQSLLTSGRLHSPFAILHIDGHPDLMDIAPRAQTSFEIIRMGPEEAFSNAGSGDFLQFAVRCGWVERIWMLFPDHRADEIAALTRMSAAAVARLVKKPIQRLNVTPSGGVELTILVDARPVEVGIFTRQTLGETSSPVATTLAHSPEFVPEHADCEFLRLISHLRGTGNRG